MGGFLSKSKTQKSKDPKWQGIGPNTPLPSSPSNNNNNSISNNNNNNSFNQSGAQPRSQNLPTQGTQPKNNLTNNKSTKTAAGKNGKSSKIMLLLKMDPKAGGQRKVITKNLISLPSDFRHTGHIGAGEVRSGQINPDKIRNQMMEVAACLKLDMNTPMPTLKTVPIDGENRESLYSGPNQVDRFVTRPAAEAVAF
ncbi:hypothetical protein BC939DRAFT_435120 [Gamsiella multidivaricata]|uniref:uncharacterized protein n=1 Tax=Gamsiella multidivaricata TaxID=101098 RepID=UPI00221E51BB|nr:uncharacterized protein BC939DRAFT_435120 [Gamsiella multidivaricata]KAG0351215.1 hypothetical protein BGZ54_003364 [Gamsiella multidivaricata]KAI7832298.1 hypothetical protein BC939DRAFT_435120 [Gamsiella multidivaricata]